jgi:hypothetical protein
VTGPNGRSPLAGTGDATDRSESTYVGFSGQLNMCKDDFLFLFLWTYGPYLSTVHLATARKQFAARTTSAETSALAARNCHPDQLVRDTVHATQLNKVYSTHSCNSNIFDLSYLTVSWSGIHYLAVAA